jgi:hypothetical protein
MNLQEHIRKVLKEYDSDKMIKLVGEYLNVMHPGFNEKDVDVDEYEDSRGFPVVIFFESGENGIYLARYHYGTKELQLSRAIFNELEGLFNDEMEYVVDWFNNEFGEDAEYVTY